MQNTKQLIIIPAFNEEDSIYELVIKAKDICDVCVVDDGSTDSTYEILSKINDVKIIRNIENKNISYSLLKGFEYAIDKKYQFIVTMDAGGGHSIDDVKKILEYQDQDLVLSFRFKKTNTPIQRKLLSFLGNIIFNFIHFIKKDRNIYFKDSTSGLRGYSSKAVHELLKHNIKSKSFGFHMEALFSSLSSNQKIIHVPISYHFTNTSLSLSSIWDAIKTTAYLFLSR